MGEIFNINNKFFQGFNKVIDCIGLSVLWLLSCIPIVTIGAANTALYYTMNKVIRHGRGYVWGEYWHAFKSNFKQSTLVWLILLLVDVFMGIDCYIMFQYARAGEKIGVLYVVFIIFIAAITMWGNCIFPYIARFENDTKSVFKNTLFIALANLPWTLLLFVIYVAACIAVFLILPVVFFMPGLYAFFSNLILEKVFRKYMSEEDIAAEQERNQEFYN